MDMRAIDKYVNRIRNEQKRKYATAWFKFRLGLYHYEPNSDEFHVSTMAAQAVRMRLDELMK